MKLGNVEQNIRIIMEMTERKWPMWFQNFAENLPLARSGLDLQDMPRRKGPAIIVGAGPSFQRLHQDNVLRKYQGKISTIICADKMLKPLLEAGITPDIVPSLEGDPMASEFYKLHSDERGAKIDSVFDAVTTHPLTVKQAMHNLSGKVWWFTHFFDNPQEERCPTCRRLSLTLAAHFMSKNKMIIEAGSNVGSFCWHLANFLECDPIILTGMDLSESPSTPLEKRVYYKAHMEMHNNDKLRVATQCYEEHENPDFHNKYVIDTVFETYRYLMMSYIQRAKVTTINATGGGAIHGTKVTGMDLEDALRINL